MDLNSLNLVTSEAILRAEALTDVQAPGATAAYLDVSLLEEKISKSTSASSSEGAIARQGAVGAAVLAGLDDRADYLVDRFCSEPDASDELFQELRSLLTRLTSLRSWDHAEERNAEASVVLLDQVGVLVSTTVMAFGGTGIEGDALAEEVSAYVAVNWTPLHLDALARDSQAWEGYLTRVIMRLWLARLPGGRGQ